MLNLLKTDLLRSISTRPSLYYGMRRLTGRFDSRCITRNTDLVIEGYPRSANSFTRTEFRNRQQISVKLADHLHVPAQLLRAVQWDIPAVMLIRSPQQSVISRCALILEAERREGRVLYVPSFVQCLKGWLAFYQATIPHTDNIVIAPFEEVTADISTIIREVNTRFGTAFADGPATFSSKEKLGYHTEAKKGYHALPTALRDGIKTKLQGDFLRQLEDSSRFRSMLDEANAMHREVLSRHEPYRVTSVS